MSELHETFEEENRALKRQNESLRREVLRLKRLLRSFSECNAMSDLDLEKDARPIDSADDLDDLCPVHDLEVDNKIEDQLKTALSILQLSKLNGAEKSTDKYFKVSTSYSRTTTFEAIVFENAGRNKRKSFSVSEVVHIDK